MSCRTTSYGSAYTTIARLGSGLSDVQTLSLYHAIRGEEASGQAQVPTQAAWNEHINDTVASVERDERLSPARRASILRRLESSRETIPDAASYRAIRLLQSRAETQVAAVDTVIRSTALATGESEDEVRARFHRLMDDVDHSRSAAAPIAVTDERVAAYRRSGLPIDRASVHAIHELQRQTTAPSRWRRPRRIERQTLASTAVAEAGYDPRGGRLEVVMHSNPGHVYAYQNVPADVWARMHTGSAGAVFAREIRGNGNYQYRNQEEADAAAFADRCSSCGQFSTSGHVCPTSGGDPVAAPNPVPVAPDPAPFRPPTRRRVVLSEPEPEPETASEPDPVEEVAAVADSWARPVHVMPNAFGGRGRFSRTTQTQIPQAGRYDRFWTPQLTEIRRLARDHTVEFPVHWQRSLFLGHNDYVRERNRERLSTNPEVAGTQPFDEACQFRVTGTASVRRDGREWTVNTRDLRCTCADYQANYDCEHVRATAGAVRTAVAPAAGDGTRTTADPAAAQLAAETAMQHDWTRNEALVAEARQSWAADDDQAFSNNFQLFENEVKLAEERVAAGESPVLYQRENAMDGACAAGSNEGFGIELEFDLSGVADRRAALNAIGRDLYAAGLTQSELQRGYHAGASTVHREHQGGWRYEADCTVDGEIISPVMQDTPETWETIERVCNIIKQHGGKATARTGSHVHVSAPNMTGAQAANLLHTVNQHEDVIYRLSSNPAAGQHRNMRWCGPNREIADGVNDLTSVRRNAYGHNSGLNLQHVTGSGADHPELRHWDGTLDPAIIQAQAKMSVALVKAAERNQGQQVQRRKEPVGSHHKRLLALRGRSRRRLSSEELREDSATARSFADTLFRRPEDRAQVASLFAVTKWTR